MATVLTASVCYILAKRAMDLGADVQFEHEVEDLFEFADADLIVACDSISSRVRQLYADHFQTNVVVGQNKYLWLGTHKVFDAFTFAFEKTLAGWIWFHAYRFDAETSTCIVECSPEASKHRLRRAWARRERRTLGRDLRIPPRRLFIG